MSATQALEAFRIARWNCQQVGNCAEDEHTSSFSSFTAKAAEESANVTSTSSTSFEISLYVFLHRSTKGPTEVSFARTPTFFCIAVRIRYRINTPGMTHACRFDLIGDLFKKLFIDSCIFSTDQDLNIDFAALQGFQMFRCIWSVLYR